MSETERIYTVPLKKAWNAQRYRRCERAITELKDFTKRHMKAEKVVIESAVNEIIWSRGIRNPPRRIRVKMTKDSEGTVNITLAEAEKETPPQ
jgi:large subunit ribosomal protein L31e